METLKITSARFLKKAKKKKEKEKLQGPLIVLVKCAVTSHGCNIRLPLLVHLREDWTPPNNQQRALCRSWERERSTRLRRLTGKCQPRRARRDQYCMHVVVRAGSRPEPGLLPARWIRGETLKGGGKKRVNCLFSRCWNLWEVAGFVFLKFLYIWICGGSRAHGHQVTSFGYSRRIRQDNGAVVIRDAQPQGKGFPTHQWMLIPLL